MKSLSNYQRRGFLKDHPPITQRVLVASTGTERTLLAGTVLGLATGKHDAFVVGMEASCILAEDITVPAVGDAYALAYTHAAVVTSELIWAEGVSAADQQTALAALRGKGVHASEA